MGKHVWTMLCVAAVLWGAGCAGLQPNYESPTVSVRSVQALPSDGMAPRFEIGLHVVNPNRSPLKLRGVAYTVKIEGHRLLTGVTNDLPAIAAYGEGDVVLGATADLFSSISLITDLLKAHRETVSYELDVKLDLEGFRPNIHVERKGEISLPSASR